MSDVQYLSQQAVFGEFLRIRKAYKAPEWLGRLMKVFPGADWARVPLGVSVAGPMAERAGAGMANKPTFDYFDLRVKEYEAGAQLDEKDMRRDATKTLTTELLLSALAKRDAEHFERLFWDVLLAGSSTLCYDGSSYFFADSHTYTDGTYTSAQDNNISVTVANLPCAVHGLAATPSVEEIALSACKGIETMKGFRDKLGDYPNEDAKVFDVFLGPTMMVAAACASKQTLNGNGASNLLEALAKDQGFQINWHVSPRLSTWTVTMAILRGDAGVPAFIGLEEELHPKTRLKTFDPENSDAARKGEFFRAEIRANRKLALGHWANGIYVTMA